MPSSCPTGPPPTAARSCHPTPRPAGDEYSEGGGGTGGCLWRHLKLHLPGREGARGALEIGEGGHLLRLYYDRASISRTV